MKGFLKFSVIALLAVTVSACAGRELQHAKMMQPTGSPYNVELSRGYLELAQNEYGEGDYKDSDNFAVRANTAGMGKNVPPESISSRKLPGDKVGELTAARQRLVDAQDRGGAAVAPSDTARAQVMFDCWMQEQEENRQPEDIRACRDGFLEAIGHVELALTAKPAPAARIPANYLVFFNWNSDVLTPEAADIVAVAAANAMKKAGTRIAAVGHTDRSGSPAYNMGLSVRRAEAVKTSLEANGIEAADIGLEGMGELENLVPTKDGVREPQNRRVEIIFD